MGTRGAVGRWREAFQESQSEAWMEPREKERKDFFHQQSKKLENVMQPWRRGRQPAEEKSTNRCLQPIRLHYRFDHGVPLHEG